MNTTSTFNPALEGYLSEHEMARIRGVKERTLRAERARGEGPPYIVLNRRVLYPEPDWRDYLRLQVRKPVRSAPFHQFGART